jgi:radical SAM superfamily enzyme YgiQ (UPF0313 family)
MTELLEARPSERFFHYLSLFLQLAVEAPEQLMDDKILRTLLDKHGSQAREFVEKFDHLLRHTIGSYGLSDCIGVSVYQLLFSHSLFFAHRLRVLFPDTPLVLGGNHFDMAIATETVRSQSWIDAVCLGPGEQALVDLITSVKVGAAVAQADIPRLIHSFFLSDIENGKKKWNIAFEGRSDYAAIGGYHGVEWNPSVQRIQVLGRRGCARAVCTFCARMHVITKEYVFDPSMSLMRIDTRRLLQLYFAGDLPDGDRTNLSFYTGRQVYVPREKNNTLSISIDADDVDVFALLDLLRWLKDEIPQGKQVIILSSYAPARQMARSEVHSLGKLLAEAPGLNVIPAIPIETLNPKTTITMKKGGNLVDHIKAMKVGLDAGCQIRGMYFSYYPKESPEDVTEEAYYLSRAFHLIGAGTYNPYIYLGSRRDPIGQAPEEYGIELEPRIDPLMNRLGMALDASYCVRYSVKDDSQLSQMQQLYIEFLHDFIEFRSVGDVSKLLRALWHGLQCLFGMSRLRNFACMRRAYWLCCTQFAFGKTEAKLYVGEDGCVYQSGFLPRPRKFILTSNELAVLRFLYQQRRISDLRAKFAELDDILSQFDQNGWTVRYKQTLMAVVNDPRGLCLLADEHELEHIRIHYEELDDGVAGRIVPGRHDFTLVTGRS